MTRDGLIENNLGLVHACAGRFVGRGVEYDDLYAAGCLGLVKAAENFDPALGYRLSTYAVPVILGEIKRLFRDGGSIKVSRGLKELSLKAKAVCDEYLKQHGEEIKIAELSEKLGVDIYRASEALSASMTVMSLSAPEEDGSIDIPVDGIEEELCEKLSLKEALSRLDPPEKQLITYRYYQHKTQQETARLMNTTQVQISRREKKILMKLRTMLL